MNKTCFTEKIRKTIKWVSMETVLSGFLLFLAISGILIHNVSLLVLAIVGLTFEYVYYRLYAKKLTKTEKERAQTLTKKAIKTLEETSPTMEDSITRGLAPLGEKQRYVLIQKELALKQYSTILDNGCAESIVGIELAKVGKYVVGLDIARAHLVAKGKERAKSLKLHNIEFLVGDAENLPFRPHSFHAVVCSEVIEHVLHPLCLLQEINQVLVKGGLLVLTTENALRMPLSFNPLVWLEYILGFHFGWILSRRSWIANSWWVKNKYGCFIHRDFTLDELKRILNDADLSIVKISSFKYPLTIVVNLLMNLSFSKWMRVEEFLGRIPILKYMGCHLFLLARK